MLGARKLIWTFIDGRQMKLPKTYTMDTRRCRLQFISKDDVPHIFSATRYDGFNDGMKWDPPKSEAALLAPFQSKVSAWESGDSYCFTIVENISAEFIGRIVVRREEEPGVWSIGFWTHPLSQNKGYMSEVLPKVIELVFSLLGALRVEASHALWNDSSKRVLERAGMQFISYQPHGFKKNGAWVEENLLAITKEAWQENTEPN